MFQHLRRLALKFGSFDELLRECVARRHSFPLSHCIIVPPLPTYSCTASRLSDGCLTSNSVPSSLRCQATLIPAALPQPITSKMSSRNSTGQGVLVAFSSGALSAVASTLMFQPLDLVKTRMQAKSILSPAVHVGAPIYLTTSGATIQPVGMVSTFSSVVRRETMIGLWKGISPSLTRCVPSIGVYFSTLHLLKSTFGKTDKNISPIHAVAFGASARAIAATSFLPFTVIKTRFESGLFQYNNVGHALKSIWLKEGFRGLFLGWWATLFRDAPFSAFYLLFYTQSKQVAMKALDVDQLPSHYSLPCGLVAGLLASATTQPADVIKTRMQLHPQSFSSMPHTLLATIQEGGVRSLLVGLAPRATRRTLMASFTWAFYEHISQFIQRRLNGQSQYC